MLKTSVQEALPPLFLLVNTLTSFNLTWLLLQDFSKNVSLDEMLIVAASYYASMIVSSVIGATLLREKLKEKNTLFHVTLIGAFLYVLSTLFILEKTSPSLVVVAFILGAPLGVIIPTCLTLFASYSKIEGRGRLGGIVLFLVQFFTVMIYVLASMLDAAALLVLAGWRFISATCMLFYRPFREISKSINANPMKSVIENRIFLLYFIPWFMFCLVNFTEIPVLEHFFGEEIFTIYILAVVIIVGVSAFLGGLICDLKGRRIAGILGFILLGVSYAILNLFPDADMAKLLFINIEGIAWGILYVTFIFVVWGDISEGRVREVYYLLGGFPFLLSGLIQTATQRFVNAIPIYASFSLASFFLFLAVIPLLYASETLPEKKLRERELRSYIEKAKRVREKFTKG